MDIFFGEHMYIFLIGVAKSGIDHCVYMWSALADTAKWFCYVFEPIYILTTHV